MLVAIEEFAKIVKAKWNVDVDEELLTFEFRYDWRLPPAVTQLHKVVSKNRMIFNTSYGIFHQKKLTYNDVLVTLLENSSGALQDVQHDLIISALTYPPTRSTRTVACSNMSQGK